MPRLPEKFLRLTALPNDSASVNAQTAVRFQRNLALVFVFSIAPEENIMSIASTSPLATHWVIGALLAVTPGVHAQPAPPPSPRPTSTADSARPCIPDPMKRYEIADPGESKLFSPTGDPDRDFANMMSAHHQEGVDMAKREIAGGRSPHLKAMARRIVKDQQREIVELDRWSARHNVRVSRGDAP